MDIFETKAELRAQIRSARSAIPPKQRAAEQEQLTTRLASLPAIKAAKTIGVYHAAGSEVSLEPLVNYLREGKMPRQIAYPVVMSETTMQFVRIDADDSLDFLSNPKAIITGINPNRIIDPEKIDVLLMPGVAFDEQCRRLGQGGGYYDRYLPCLRPDCLTVGIAFDEQIVDEVPTDNFDCRADYVVTPTRIISG